MLIHLAITLLIQIGGFVKKREESKQQQYVGLCLMLR